MIKHILACVLFCVPMLLSSQFLIGAMINACHIEGENEFFILQNGDSILTIQPENIDFRYGQIDTPTTKFLDSIQLDGNANYVNALNQKLPANCDLQFINGIPDSTILDNGYFLIMYKYPSDTFDFSEWCGVGMGDVKILFSADTNWLSGGNFASHPNENRFFSTRINQGTTTYYRYNNTYTSDSDGDFLLWDSIGGEPSFFGNNSSCIPSLNASLLPLQWIDIQLHTLSDRVDLNWKTGVEVNVREYHIYRSRDGFRWELAKRIGARNEIENHYQWQEPYIPGEVIYYFLESVDIDGTKSKSDIYTAYEAKLHHLKIFPNPARTHISVESIDKKSPWTISFFDFSGRSMIHQQKITNGDQIQLHSLKKGFYWVQIQELNQRHMIKFLKL